MKNILKKLFMKHNDRKSKYALFQDYLENINIPVGKNEVHKKELLEKLENENFNESQEVKKQIDFSGNIFKFPVLNYSFVLLIVLILSFSVIAYFNIYKVNNKITVKLEKGNAFIKDKPIKKTTYVNIKKQDTIKTVKDSLLNIKIENSIIQMNELSEIKTIKFKKNNNEIINKFELLKGKIYCSVNLPSKESRFEIIINNIKFKVLGTKFYLEINDEKDIILKVDEGIVEIDDLINLKEDFKKIKIDDILIYEKIKKISDNKKNILKGESVIINSKDIQEYNIKFNNFINELKSNKTDEINKKRILDKLDEFESESKTIINKYEDKKLSIPENGNNLKKEPVFKTEKVLGNSNTILKEINTGITAYNNNIYIASSYNNCIYCFDVFKRKIKWIFKDNSLNNVTNFAYEFKNNVVFGTPDKIFILNKNGQLNKTKQINKGINYWPNFIEIKNMVFIPTSENIYTFDGNTFSMLGNNNYSMGQLYISTDGENLFCSDLNSLDILIYNFKEKKIIKKLERLRTRAFMAPIVIGSHLFIADIDGNIYKYNYKDDLKTEIISINTGIVNMIYKNNILYFITTDGYFNKLNTIEFKTIDKVVKIEESPNLDKYLTKKLLLSDNEIYFSSDFGKIYYYNIKNNNLKFLNINDNIEKLPLLGEPVKIGESIYFIDVKLNIYRLYKD